MKNIAIVNPDSSKYIIKSLKSIGLVPVKIPKTGLAAKPIAGHPDLQIFVYKDKIFCHPDISLSFLKKIEHAGEIIICQTRLKPEHPSDTAYNIACTRQFAFHRKGCTDNIIRERLEADNVELIHTRQGYSKCSTLVMDEAIITADRSIHESALSAGINSLQITPGCIDLPGYKYGFIGGHREDLKTRFC